MSILKLLSVFASYEAIHWGAQLALILALSPTIVVALTPYPKAAGLLKTLLQVLNALSIAAHKDSPQGLKFPLTQSRAPSVIGSPLLKRSGFVRLGLLGALACLVLALHMVACASTWGAPVFSSGPSLQLVEISPSSPHPVQLAAGAGYSVALGEGQIAIGGKQWDLLDVSLQVLGSAISPAGVPAGALQVAPMLGTMNNLVAIGPILTPYAADGSGFLQGGRPGTAWGLHLTFPIGLGPYAPPTGIEAGPAGLPRGGTMYLP